MTRDLFYTPLSSNRFLKITSSISGLLGKPLHAVLKLPFEHDSGSGSLWVFSRILSSSKKLKHFFMVLNQGVLLQFFKGELQGW